MALRTMSSAPGVIVRWCRPEGAATIEPFDSTPDNGIAMKPTILLETLLAGFALGRACSAQSVYYTFLDGPQAGTSSTSSGVATFVIDTAADEIRYVINLSSFPSVVTSAHIRGPAAPGSSAGELEGLTPGSTITGVWNYPASVEADILHGLTYVDVHTQAFPGGELRGQILPIPSDDLCDCEPPGSSCGSTSEEGGCPNSAGHGARLRWLVGLPSASLDSLSLLCTELPPNQPGLLFMGSTAAQPAPFGDGLLCTGGFLARFPVRGSGTFEFVIEGPGLVAHSHVNFPPAGQIQAGETRYFQFWYRDPGGPCGSGSNLSNALIVQFTP